MNCVLRENAVKGEADSSEHLCQLDSDFVHSTLIEEVLMHNLTTSLSTLLIHLKAEIFPKTERGVLLSGCRVLIHMDPWVFYLPQWLLFERQLQPSCL